MYGGPKGLGDPYYREMSKMEEDPMIPQRMRDTTRSQLCRDVVADFANCSKENGFSMAWKWGGEGLHGVMPEGLDGGSRLRGSGDGGVSQRGEPLQDHRHQADKIQERQIYQPRLRGRSSA